MTIPRFEMKDLPLYEQAVRELEAAGDFAAVERATRSMLLAYGEKTLPIVRTLWRRLRDVCHSRLGKRNDAIAAAQFITRQWPGNVDDVLALARLHGEAGQHKEAEMMYTVAVMIAPPSAAALRELIKYRLAHNETDAAWAATTVLASIGELADDERAFLDARMPRGLPTGRLDRAAWKQLAPADPPADIFGLLAKPIFMAASESPISPAMWDRRFLPPQLGTSQFRAAFALAARALGLPEQPHFADPEPTASHASLDEPIDDETRELLFVAGRQAAFHRPFHLVLFHHSSIREFAALLYTARATAIPGAEVPAHLQEFVANLATRFRLTMTGDELAKLSLAVRIYGDWNAPERMLQIFRDLVDCHAARAGLLLCGDLSIARTALAFEPRAFASASLEDKMRDLQSFALSPQYVALRAQLGLGPKLVVH